MIRSATDLPTVRVLACLALLCAAAAASAKTSDRNQTMRVGSDGSDCTMSDAGACVLTGNVRITQGTLDIAAARADIKRSGGEPKSAKLTGSPVKMKQQGDDGGWVNATASQIDYDLSGDTIVLTGDAHVDQPGKGSITGGRIVYNTKSGQVQSGGDAGGGRVNMTFEPKNKPAAGADAAPQKAAPEKPAPKDGN